MSKLWTRDDLKTNPHDATDKARRVEAMFNAIAGSYDLNNRVHSLGRDQSWRRAAVRYAHLKSGDAVLDCACGTGDLAFAFADAGAAVTGLDFTAGMLETAVQKARVSKSEKWRSVKFLRGDALALPFPDASFEVISIAFGIRNVSDPVRAFSEFFRVLKPGGRLVVLEFGQPKNAFLKWSYGFYFHHIMPHTAALIAGDTSGAYQYLPRSVQTFLSSDGMVKLYSDTGFIDVSQLPMTFGIAVAYRGVKRS